MSLGTTQDSFNVSFATSYLTYPLRYAASGVFRRLSTDSERDNQNGDALSHKPMDNTNLKTPNRRHSPFQPPPLTPLVLSSDAAFSKESAKILSRQLAEEIRLLVPARLQMVDSWKLIFSLDYDGSSLTTLYDKCGVHGGSRSGFTLVIRDSLGSIFGAYLNEPFHPSGGHFYGNGECFLWRASTLPEIPALGSLPLPPSSDTTNLQRMTTIAGPEAHDDHATAPLKPRRALNEGIGGVTERIRFKAFPYSGINDYMIFCEHDYLSIGGGDGHYGLWLDASLEKGISSACLTFGNEPLSEEGIKFEIIGIEVWKIGDWN